MVTARTVLLLEFSTALTGDQLERLLNAVLGVTMGEVTDKGLRFRAHVDPPAERTIAELASGKEWPT